MGHALIGGVLREGAVAHREQHGGQRHRVVFDGDHLEAVLEPRSMDEAGGRGVPGAGGTRGPAAAGTPLRRQLRGATTPATIGMRYAPSPLKKLASCLTSNTGCVTANSAPASAFKGNRDSSRSSSTAPGFTPTPIAQLVGAPIGLLPGSSPWFSRYTRFVRPIESMSKTAVASG